MSTHLSSKSDCAKLKIEHSYFLELAIKIKNKIACKNALEILSKEVKKMQAYFSSKENKDDCAYKELKELMLSIDKVTFDIEYLNEKATIEKVKDLLHSFTKLEACSKYILCDYTERLFKSVMIAKTADTKMPIQSKVIREKGDQQFKNKETTIDSEEHKAGKTESISEELKEEKL